MTHNRQFLSLLSALLLCGSVLASNLIVYRLFDQATAWYPLPPVIALIYTGLFVLFTLLIWKSALFQVDTGWRGLLAALILGLLGGTVNALYQILLSRWLSEKNFFRPGLEILGPVFIFSLLYQLIYRRSSWDPVKNQQNRFADETYSCFMTTLLIGLGTALILESLVALLFFSHGDSMMIRRSEGIWLLGLGVLLLGFSDRGSLRRRERTLMQFAGLVMSLSGMIIAVIL